MTTAHTPDAMAEKLPRMRIAFACLVDASHFYTVCSVFSYAGVLCADLKWVSDRNSAGFLAGWLQSSNVFGRSLMSSVWGYIAARYGFDVVLTITLASLFVGGLLKWHAAYRSCDLRMDLCIDSRFSSACSKSTWFMPSISGPLPLLFAALSRQEGPQVSEEFAGGICHNSDKAVHHTDVTQMACSIDHLHAIQPGFRPICNL